MKFALALMLLCATAFAGLAPGLTVTFSSGGATDAASWERVALYVPGNQPATPFLEPGPFQATWTGFVNVDLRSEYTFSTEHTGVAKVTVNGVLQDGKPIRLNKGANSISVEYESPTGGAAKIRLFWKPRKGLWQPVPDSAFTHEPNEDTRRSQQLRLGRELFIEHRCANCHGMDVAEKLDAPAFIGIGSRRNQAWMASWIADPRAHRPEARMPKLLSVEQSNDVATYLASLKEEEAPVANVAGHPETGAKLFSSLNCAACHRDEKFSLRDVSAKFASGHLAAFLLDPGAHFESIRMPRFKLTPEEAASIAAHLTQPHRAPAASGDSQKGRGLVQTSGCLNCHSGPVDNHFKAAPIADPDKGCLDKTNQRFAFSENEHASLAAFLRADGKSLMRVVPSESVERLSRNLNCRECHDKMEGLPRFDLLGAKLRPEWSAQFIAGQVGYKPRPWFQAQMPASIKWAKELAEGLAARHGVPPVTPGEPPGELAETGRKLIGIDGGFSCVTCHAIGERAAAQVTEAAGINFWWTAERVLPDYFHRWLANPLAIDPTTKMPVYFDEEGRSPLADILDGDGAKQRQAIWDYLRQGRDMIAPER